MKLMSMAVKTHNATKKNAALDIAARIAVTGVRGAAISIHVQCVCILLNTIQIQYY